MSQTEDKIHLEWTRLYLYGHQESVSLFFQIMTWHSLSSLLGPGFCSNFILEAHTNQLTPW